MRFRVRFTGQLVLANGPISSSRAVEKGQNLSLSAKTAERFGRSLYGHVKAGRLVAMDPESNVIADLKEAPKDVELLQVAQEEAPEPKPELAKRK